MEAISARDGMLSGSGGDRAFYRWVGEDALKVIRHCFNAARMPMQAKTVLDMPCGHGRVARHLKDHFGEAELTVCDLDRDGVDFCAETFGAKGVYSSVDPSEVAFDQSFDLIWCGSLLTHIRFDQWPGFLELFRRHLSPEGLLVFTTLGKTAANMMRSGEDLHGLEDVSGLLEDFHSGTAYVDYPFQTDYGICLASPERVMASVQDFRVVTFTEGRWANHQDVTCVCL